MKGARSLPVSWSVAEKLWWEVTMEWQSPSGASAVKTASFQVGEPVTRATCEARPASRAQWA